jgi:peptidoglycan/LPS O-acetylase OafA/YrhL
LAALAVFLGHTNFHWFFGVSSFGPQNGQDYVIVFFVLSGFVISWSIDRKKGLQPCQYIFDRVTRLWSVAIPALVIGFSMDLIGRSINPSTYTDIFSPNHLEMKYLISSFFMHETWFFSIRPGSNGPFWSLSYEFFYYMIFGSVMLLTSWKNKILAFSFWIIVAGPKILLLFPCWLIGCIAFQACKNIRPHNVIALFLILSSGAFLSVRMLERWSNWNPWNYSGLGNAPWFYSAKFLDDYLTALTVGVMLFAANSWFGLEEKNKGRLSKMIRKMADCSFSLYAIHFPVMALLGALWTSGKITFMNIHSAIVLILVFAFLFASAFEQPLKAYRQLILKLVPTLKLKCGINS